MLRSLLRAGAALAFAFLIAPAVRRPRPPPGLAYDEIVRVVVNATPPPPGNFQADLAALNSRQAVAASPTPAPEKRGISLGNHRGRDRRRRRRRRRGRRGRPATLISNAVENAVQASLGAQFGALGALARSFLQPHLMRYAYWNGWERVDDVTRADGDDPQVRRRPGDPPRPRRARRMPSTIPAPSRPRRRRPAPPVRGRGDRRRRPIRRSPAPPSSSLTEATRALGPLRMENQARPATTRRRRSR